MTYNEAVELRNDLNFIVDNLWFLFDHYKKDHTYPDHIRIGDYIDFYCYVDALAVPVITFDYDRDEIMYFRLTSPVQHEVTILYHGTSNFGWRNDSKRNLGFIRTETEEEYFMNSTIYSDAALLSSVLITSVNPGTTCLLRFVNREWFYETVKSTVKHIKELKK